jgi:hypothetical protein
MSYEPAELDFTVYKNATWSKTLTFTALNLTGYTAVLTVKDAPNGNTLQTINGSISAGTDSVVTLTMSLSTVTAISWSRGVYELVLTSGGGVADVILFGAVAVVPF